MKKLFLALLLAVASAAQAEVFYDINYFDNFGSIKKKYPNAIYEKLKPAWLKQSEALIQISGRGLQHSIVVAFEDARDVYRNWLNDPAFAEQAEGLKRSMALPDEDALYVKWVRVIYDTPVSVEKFKRKYGKSECRTNENFDDVCYFPGRAIEALLTKDRNFVIRADTDFTKSEREKGLQPTAK